VNAAGSAASSNATLTVLIPATVTLQPVNVIMRGVTNLATWGYTFSNGLFTVAASSSTPMTYQWRFNGADIAGATNSLLTISNATPANEGLYDCVITDGVGPIISAAARLSIIIPALVIEQPQSETTLVVGDSVTFSVGVTGSPPFGFRWRREGVPIVQFPGAPVTTVTNVPLSYHSNKFTVVITNAGTPSQGFISSNAFVFVLADSDGDHMPDTWEISNGLNHTNAMDGTNDLDGDTMSNRDEWVAGTDPQDPQSYLKVDEISALGGAALSFVALSNKSYSIQYSDRLSNGGWTRLMDVIGRTNSRIEMIVDPNPAAGRYYRLVTPRQP
jgi:hypothetical protein